jgi:flagellum-specific ATP synthase
VFTLLPKLMERAGKYGRGSITGLYTVLVENDDMNEPIADSVRSIVDGHIVLSRDLAHKNHYPAIDVLASISRLMTQLVSEKQSALAGRMRQLMAEYQKGEDLIQIGAYVKGTNPSLDQAIEKMDAILAFLQQPSKEFDKKDIWNRIETILR